MNRALVEVGVRVAGRDALPSPAGDVAGLRRSAVQLSAVIGAAEATATVRGELGPRLADVWTGPAAAAATAEADELARRCQVVLGSAPEARDSIDAYASALDEAQALTRTLQRRWDEAHDTHERECARIPLAHPEEPGRSSALATADEAIAAARSLLSRRHAALVTELARVAARSTRGLESACATAFPAAHEPSAYAVRRLLVAGLPMATGALEASEARSRALTAATSLRSLGAVPSGEALREWLRTNGSMADDPAFAQAIVEEMGMDTLLTGVTEAGASGGPESVDSARELITVVGTLVLSAAAAAPAGTDPATARRLAAGAAQTGEALLSAASRTYRSADGRTEHAGWWLVGQLLVGARGTTAGAGERRHDRPLPPGAVARLAAAVAQGELAESRDGRSTRRHGTTLTPDGGEAFASYFRDGSRTGDALHQVLLEVGPDPAARRQVLSAVVDQPWVRSSRGEPLVLAEHLVRRWISHDRNASGLTADLQLATNDDLLELMTSTDEGDADSVELRRRVMAEIGRTNAVGRLEHALVEQYEHNTAPLEGASVPWLVERPSVLSGAELDALVGAYAVSTDFHAGSKEPAANHRALIDAELAQLRARVESASGDEMEEVLRRLGRYDAAGSAALHELAVRQDAQSRSTWEALAEAKNVVLGLRRGDAGELGQAFAMDGTTRSPLDDLVISAISSDVVLAQAEANEQRTASLRDRVSAVLAAVPHGSGRAAPALARGRALAPPVPSSRELREARFRQIRETLESYLDGRAHDGLREQAEPRDPKARRR